MAALYADENYPLGIVEHLRALGHDIVTAPEVGSAGRAVPDDEVLSFAAESRRAMITHNRLHFIRLHRDTAGRHSGVIVCTYDPDELRQAQRVDAAIREVASALTGKLLRVYRPPK